MRKRRVAVPATSGTGLRRATVVPGLRVVLPPEAGAAALGGAVRLGKEAIAQRKAERLAERSAMDERARELLYGSRLGELKKKLLHFLRQTHQREFNVKIGGKYYSLAMHAIDGELMVFYGGKQVGDLREYQKVVEAAARIVGAKASLRKRRL